eukprot:366111-Chlamydomonas_euryale.AAC.11
MPLNCTSQPAGPASLPAGLPTAFARRSQAGCMRTARPFRAYSRANAHRLDQDRHANCTRAACIATLAPCRLHARRRTSHFQGPGRYLSDREHACTRAPPTVPELA